MLVHLVGDIHQPLHAADNGGNGVTLTNRMCVEYGAPTPTACKLHTYWDTNLVKSAARGLSEIDAASFWAATYAKLPAADSASAFEWAVESNALARGAAYRFEAYTCKTKRQSFAADAAYDEDLARSLPPRGRPSA